MTGLSGSRRPRWTVELLDRNHYVKRRLDGVLSHSIELAGTERLGGNAKLELNAEASGDVDWLNGRVRFTYDPEVEGVDPWPLGVFLLTSPQEQHGDGKTIVSVDCLHLPAVVDRVYPTRGITLAKGTRIVQWVVSLLRDEARVPAHLIAATDLGTVAAAERSWPPTESLLTVINDVLTSAGYWSLRANTAGQLVVAPWEAPITRPPAYEFTKDEVGVTRPDWTREQDLSSIPNRVVASTAGSEEEESIVGVAELTDPEDPLSIPNRGIVGKTYDIEATDQASANAQAKQFLDNALEPVLKVGVEHALVPVAPNDTVLYEVGGELLPFTVQRMSIGDGFDAHVKATWRGVTGSELQEGSEDSD